MTVIPTEIAYRLKYSDGMFLTAATENLEQDYWVRTTALQNFMLYTPGVLSGLAVTQAGSATVAIDPGGGIDPMGNFLILPGSSAVPLAVPSGSPNPSSIYLVYPSAAQQATGMQPDIVNLAGCPTLVATNSAAPASGILLAQVALDDHGQITLVTDQRVRVTSRLGTPLTLSSDRSVDLPTTPGGTAHGTLTVAIDELPTEQAPFVKVVPFNDQGAPAFATMPRIICQVEGAIAYPTAVSDVTPTGFTLTLAAPPVTPSSDMPVAPVAVAWLAS